MEKKLVRWDILRKHWRQIALITFVIMLGAVTLGAGAGLMSVENDAVGIPLLLMGIAILVVGIYFWYKFRQKHIFEE